MPECRNFRFLLGHDLTDVVQLGLQGTPVAERLCERVLIGLGLFLISAIRLPDETPVQLADDLLPPSWRGPM